jgi:hypothetical protein
MLTAANPGSSVSFLILSVLELVFTLEQGEVSGRTVLKVTEIMTHCSWPHQCEAASVYESARAVDKLRPAVGRLAYNNVRNIVRVYQPCRKYITSPLQSPSG